MSVLIVAAVAAEVAALVAALQAVDTAGAAAGWRTYGCGQVQAAVGRLAGVDVIIAPCGVGKTNAAATSAALLESLGGRGSVEIVLATGIAGATQTEGSSVPRRTLLLASEEIFADEGVETEAGFLSASEIGLAVASVADAPLEVATESTSVALSQRLRLDPTLVETAREALLAAGLPVVVGPLATVSSCSGSARREAWLTSTWGAIGESMEGAAFALVAARYGVPFIELRAVSNHTGPRDRATWDVAGAIAAATAGVMAVLPALACAELLPLLARTKPC